jgi:hypothetical protein
MDDLVVLGVLGLIGVYLALFFFLVAIYAIGRLVYTSLATGDFWLVLGGTIAILISAIFYIGIGCWLRKTGRI